MEITPDGCEVNGVIEEGVYIEQPQGFEVFGKESHVCRLKKALYGLKKSPRAWYAHINSYLMTMGFTKSKENTNLYFKVVKNALVILLLYVDDLFLTGVDPLFIQCKKKLDFEFDMKDLGLMHYYLGLEVWKKPSEVFLGQGKYVLEILQRFGMMDCKSMVTNLNKLIGFDSRLVDSSMYRQLIVSLMYLVNTRLDI